MSPRRDVGMAPEEQERFLDETRTITLASLGPDGWPHVVAMWFCRIEGRIHMTTFRKSQKAANLRRDPRVTILAESGATYAELRGLMIRGHAELVEDLDLCLDVLRRVREKHFSAEGDGADAALRAQAEKRVVLRIVPRRVSSWDHGKLGGRY
jgi:PPOX class probable F420-dependent enzyme